MPRSAFVLLAALPMLLLRFAQAQAPACEALPQGPLTLAVAEARLERCNRDILNARAAIEAATADRVVAGQRPNPTLTLGASNVNPSVGIGAGSLREKTFDSALRLEQLIERGGKGELREKQAEALLAASRADVSDVVRQQRLALRTSFADLATAQTRARVVREYEALAEESAKAATRRLEAGDVSRAEANRFLLDAVRAANDRRQAEIDLERAKLDFARLVAAEAYVQRLVVVELQLPQATLRAAGGARPDIVAARNRVAAAEAARELARALSTRDITVGVQGDHWPTSATNMQGTGNSFGATISIPLQVRHANEGELMRAMADVDTARLALARLEAQQESDRLLAEADYESAHERARRIEADLLPLAREVAKSAEFAYARGATSLLDLLDARRALRTVELDAAQSRADAAKAWARQAAARETVEE
jgi:cobalt-zinc-cadmium efflux system outer membrane protein